MPIRVLITGANGRMGQAAVKAVSEDPDLTLVGTVSRQDDLTAAIKQNNAQVVVEFTNAESVFANTTTIIAAGAHPVIGSSGLTLAQIKKFQAECAALKLGGIIAANFSLGAVLLMKYSKEIAKYFSHVEIIEMHHDGKLDSPSGTSLHTAEMIAANFKREDNGKQLRETIPGSRGASHHQIPIHAVRLPGLVAHEQVIFGGVGETLTLKHDSIDRISFMPGVCLSCKKVVEMKELVYGLENIL